MGVCIKIFLIKICRKNLRFALRQFSIGKKKKETHCNVNLQCARKAAAAFLTLRSGQ